MLVNRVLEELDIPQPEDRGGNPLRGSRLGRCARQSAYMLWPGQFPPAPLPARAKLVFRFGDLIHDLIRSEFRRIVPGQWGMEESRFFFRVPLSIKEGGAALRKLETGVLLGTILGGFNPDKDKVGTGIVFDPSLPCLWVPLRVDGIADLSAFDARYGLATAEIKSMATGSFRRALQGEVDYAYRVQMAAAVDAAGLDTQLYVSVRKDTCHLLEVVYSKRATAIDVRFTKSSKLVELLRMARNGEEAATDWEAAEVQHPFEPTLLEEARARVRRILLARFDALPEREYGPSFECVICDGTGIQTRQKGRATPLKKPKPCEGCAETGKAEEAALPFQCSYCPFTEVCYGQVYRLEVTDKPMYLVKRADFEASGIAFSSPEPEELSAEAVEPT